MSKKFRLLYETAFDSKTSKSDENLLSDDKQDLACRLVNRLQLSASTNSVQRCADIRGGVARGSAAPSRFPCKNRLFAFLLRPKKRAKYRSTDSMVTSSSLSLESIATSESLSSHSSESPRYCDRFPEPHVLSPISDKSSQDAVAEISDLERRKGSAALAFAAVATDHTAAPTTKTKPPQSLGLIKLNRDHRQQHHGSDSGISVGSKPGDNYQELLDVPFDMPKLRRKQKSEFFRDGQPPTACSTMIASEQPSEQPSDVTESTTSLLPFDMPKLRKRGMDNGRAKNQPSFDFGIGNDVQETCGSQNMASDHNKLEELPFDIPKLNKINNLHETEKKPDRSSLFLDVKPSTNDKPSLKTFQNKSMYLFIFRTCTYDLPFTILLILIIFETTIQIIIFHA